MSPPCVWRERDEIDRAAQCCPPANPRRATYNRPLDACIASEPKPSASGQNPNPARAGVRAWGNPSRARETPTRLGGRRRGRGRVVDGVARGVARVRGRLGEQDVRELKLPRERRDVRVPVDVVLQGERAHTELLQRVRSTPTPWRATRRLGGRRENSARAIADTRLHRTRVAAARVVVVVVRDAARAVVAVVDQHQRRLADELDKADTTYDRCIERSDQFSHLLAWGIGGPPPKRRVHR